MYNKGGPAEMPVRFPLDNFALVSPSRSRQMKYSVQHLSRCGITLVYHCVSESIYYLGGTKQWMNKPDWKFKILQNNNNNM